MPKMPADGWTGGRVDGWVLNRPVYPSTRLPVLIAAALSLACGGSKGPTPLVVYSPHGRDQLTLMERTFEAANPDIDVRWLDMGSQDALDRVRSERANPQGDVWFGGPSTLFIRAAGDSLLASHVPTWAAATPERARGVGGFYHAVYETPTVIMYNADAVKAADAPKDWDEVLLPR